MDLSKSFEFFNPTEDDARIHIIGCGSVGSTVAENLARCGISKMTLWDFDTVESHNIVNQMFTSKDVGRLKVDAVKDILAEINPEGVANIKTKPNGWNGESLSGYVFLAVDNIELRKKIVEDHYNNQFVKAMFDFRTGLTDAQHFAADWRNAQMKKDFLGSMQFSHEEAMEATPMSACGLTLGVAPTVRIVSAYGVCNFINFVKGEGIKKFMNFNIFNLDADPIVFAV